MLAPALMVVAVLALDGEAARLGDEPVAPTSTSLGSDVGCNLTGEARGDRCEKLYWVSRLAALVVPAYVLSTDGSVVHHGMVWTLAVDVPEDGWRGHFNLGLAEPDAPAGSQIFRLGFAAQLAWYPGPAVIEGRITVRARILSLTHPDNATRSALHLWVAAGIFGNRIGLGPRIELRGRLGHLAWGGLVLAVGFQPNLFRNYYAVDVSVGLEAPWMWWW